LHRAFDKYGLRDITDRWARDVGVNGHGFADAHHCRTTAALSPVERELSDMYRWIVFESDGLSHASSA